MGGTPLTRGQWREYGYGNSWVHAIPHRDDLGTHIGDAAQDGPRRRLLQRGAHPDIFPYNSTPRAFRALTRARRPRGLAAELKATILVSQPLVARRTSPSPKFRTSLFLLLVFNSLAISPNCRAENGSIPS
jgi:hypothetical protein